MITYYVAFHGIYELQMYFKTKNGFYFRKNCEVLRMNCFVRLVLLLVVVFIIPPASASELFHKEDALWQSPTHGDCCIDTASYPIKNPGFYLNNTQVIGISNDTKIIRGCMSPYLGYSISNEGNLYLAVLFENDDRHDVPLVYRLYPEDLNLIEIPHSPELHPVEIIYKNENGESVIESFRIIDDNRNKTDTIRLDEESVLTEMRQKRITWYKNNLLDAPQTAMPNGTKNETRNYLIHAMKCMETSEPLFSTKECVLFTVNATSLPARC